MQENPEYFLEEQDGQVVSESDAEKKEISSDGHDKHIQKQGFRKEFRGKL